MDRILVENIGELITLAPLVAKGVFTSIEEKDLGCEKNAWLLAEKGKVAGFGSGKPPENFQRADTKKIDARGGLVMPALIDSHSHLLFAGSRSHEFYQRLAGATYQEIAAAGGGIRSSVTSCHQASDEALILLLEQRLTELGSFGVSNVEVKTGYGLTVKEELRHLLLLKGFQTRKASSDHPKIHVTCLALHAFPIDGKNPEVYIDEICSELLPEISRLKLAKWVDAFIETGYYSVAQCERYMKKAKDLGLGIRIHADEFTDAGGAEAAARWGAKSADHLQFASDSGIKAMAQSGVVATLLPGTSLYTKIPFRSANAFREYGCPMAIATDYNPGSSKILNLPLLTSVAALHCGLSGPEAIAAATLVPAYSLDLKKKGALAIGFDADFFIHPAGSRQNWLADFGATRVGSLWLQGLPRIS